MAISSPGKIFAVRSHWRPDISASGLDQGFLKRGKAELRAQGSVWHCFNLSPTSMIVGRLVSIPMDDGTSQMISKCINQGGIQGTVRRGGEN